MTWTSLFASAGASCVASVMIRKITRSRCGFVVPYHFGFGTSVSATLSWKFEILYGPPENVGMVLLNHLYDVPSPAGVLTSPCWAAMCAGSSGEPPLYIVFQSAYGLAITI